MIDNIKLIIAVALMVTAITLFYAYSEISTLLRVLALLATVGVSLFIASTTTMGGAAWSYVKATNVEVRKVVWPTRQETLQTTLIVIIMVILVALMLWGIDSILGWAVRALTL
jgi:preprotein translocase subunit SecE